MGARNQASVGLSSESSKRRLTDDLSRSLVDFEHWHEARDPINMTERAEFERWGLHQRKVYATHWQEFFHSEGLTQKKK